MSRICQIWECPLFGLENNQCPKLCTFTNKEEKEVEKMFQNKILAEKSHYVPDSNGNESTYLIQSEKKFHIVNGWSLTPEDALTLQPYHRVGSYGYAVNVWDYPTLLEAQKEFDKYE